MTDRNERLSALVDSELPPGEIEAALAELAAEPALRDTWSRYQLIGTAIRRGVPDVLDPRLAARIAAAVDAAEPETGSDDIEAPSPDGRQPAGGARWRRTLGGLAMAASVAAVALYGVRFVTAPVPEAPGAPALAKLAPSAPTAMTVAATATSDPTPLDERRLSDYLQRHNELALGGRVRALPPYVRVVSASGPGSAR